MDMLGVKWVPVVESGLMLLTGTFVRSTDEKFRLSIPKPIRRALGYPDESAFYLAPGTDGSLALYPEKAFAQLADQLGQASPTGPDVRAFSRLFYAQAHRIEADRQGRIRIPVELAKLARLGRDVVVVGVRDHLEIWDQSLWEEYLAARLPRYDEIAERAFRGETPTLASPSKHDHSTEIPTRSGNISGRRTTASM